MRVRCFRWPVAVALLLAFSVTHALEFRSVKETGAVLYEAPSLTSKRLFVVSRYYPVEVLTIQPGWARVRDVTGGIAWILSDLLSSQAILLVTAEQADVREANRDDANILFSVVKDGFLEMQEPPSKGWVKAKHLDGSQGYVRVRDVWGL